MRFIQITSSLSTYLVLLALAALFGGIALSLATSAALIPYVVGFSLILAIVSVPATLLCLFACYKRKIITIGHLLFSLFFTLVTFGLFYIGVVFTLRRDVKGYLISTAGAEQQPH